MRVIVCKETTATYKVVLRIDYRGVVLISYNDKNHLQKFIGFKWPHWLSKTIFEYQFKEVYC